MPILNVEVVLLPNESLSPDLAAELANRAGDIFGSPPGSTWVKVHAIPCSQYSENGAAPLTEAAPVFVTILKAKSASVAERQAEVAKLAPAIAQTCGRPEMNVHILYQPEGAGRVAFGGRLCE